MVRVMKTGVLFCVCLFLTVMPAYSEIMYITDDIRVMLRSDAGMDRRIVAMPKSGAQVEVLEELEDGWSRVRLSDDKEGWLLSRYLTPGPPSKDVIAKLKSENAVLKRQVKTLTEEKLRLRQEGDDFRKALSKNTRNAEILRESYESLRKGSSEYLSLKASHEKASKDLATKTKRQAELEKELKALRDSETLQWFLGGAAVLFVGLIIGFMARRPKRRPSLL